MSWNQPPGGPWAPPPPGNPNGAPPPYGGPPGPPPGGQGFYGGPGVGLPPHRGPLVLILAIVSYFVMLFGCSMCGPLSLLSLGLSIPAMVVGKRDLAAMEAGAMDPSGKEITQIGWVLAIVSTALSVLLGLVMVALMVLYGGMIGAAILEDTSHHY